MKYLNYVLSSLIRFVAIFSISFVWINYNIRNFGKSTTISAIIAISVEIAVFWISKYKAKKANHSTQNIDKLNRLDFCMTVMPYIEVQAYYYNIIKQQYCSQKYKDCIVAVSEKEKMCFVPSYKSRACSTDDIIECIKIATLHKANTLYILSNNFDKDAIEYSGNIRGMQLYLYNLQKTLDLIILNSPLPDCTLRYQAKAFSWKHIAQYTFNRKNAKTYFISALIILGYSILIPYNIYYIIMGTILFAFSLISRYKKEPK